MPGQTVSEFRPVALQAATALSRSPVAHATVISICDSPAWLRKMHAQSEETNSDGLGCARGLRAAFLMEIGTALLAYGIWHWMHLIR
jgi:hypothetical protein